MNQHLAQILLNVFHNFLVNIIILLVGLLLLEHWRLELHILIVLGGYHHRILIVMLRVIVSGARFEFRVLLLMLL